jgi:hypothetical protein
MLVILCCLMLLQAIPPNVILVKGAVPGASDSSTPLPEGGAVREGAYRNDYFGLTYPLPADWTENVLGPPPSEGGSYVLSMLIPSEKITGTVKGSVLISAQDLFFGHNPATSAKEVVAYARGHLPPSQSVERAPAEVRIGGRTFTRLDYGAPVAGLHWSLLATDSRCHAVEFVFMARDAATLNGLVAGLAKTRWPDENSVSLCVADYAVPANVVTRVEPLFPVRRFNSVPVRLIIDPEGRVRHVHVISAFPDQTAAITQALLQWRFKPYVVDGEPREIETGLLFGSIPPRTTSR